jgi:hypothetical protein
MSSTDNQRAYHYQPPSPSQIKAAYVLIRKYKSEIHDHAIRIKELRTYINESTDATVKEEFRTMINDLSLEMEERKQLLEDQKMLIAPMRLLPAELLIHIFEYYVHHYDQSIWTIMAVCRSWRYLGMGAPRIWNKFQVTLGNAGAPKARQKYNQSRLPDGVDCRTMDTLEMVLRRSGVIPVHVTVTIGPDVFDLTMLQLLCVQAGSRIKSLHLKGNIYQSSFGTQAWANINASFPNLDTIVLDCSLSPLFKAIFTTACTTSTSLHSISFNYPCSTRDLEPLSHTLKKIKHFRLTGQYMYFNHDDTMGHIWKRFVQIKTIFLARLYDSSPFAYSTDGSFGQLETMALQDVSFNGLANSPTQLRALKHIHIDTISARDVTANIAHYSIQLHQVTHFTLNNKSYAPLLWFSLPNLVSLELYGNQFNKTQSNDEIDTMWNPDTAGQIPCPSTILHLETKANDAYILSALSFMDHIRDLYLYYDTPSAIGTKLMSALAIPPKKRISQNPEALRSWQAPKLPSLQILTIVCKKVTANEKNQCLGSLEQIREARLGTASEMQTLRLSMQSVVGKCSLNRAREIVSPF